MSYEIDNLKRELSTLKYEVAVLYTEANRKVDDESFRRKLADLESNINRKITDLVNDNANLRDRLDRLIETIESNNV